MKKIIIIILLGLLLPVLTKAQSHTFTKTMRTLGVTDTWSKWEDSPNRLKVENLGAGKYRIVVYSISNSYSGSSIYVKYLTYKNGIYLYAPYHDTDKEMYSEVKMVGADKKLSRMALGQAGDVIMYYDSNVRAALRCVR